jgi:hypothetical protein
VATRVARPQTDPVAGPAPRPARVIGRTLAILRTHRADLLAALFLLCATLVFFAPLLRGQTFSAVSLTQALVEPWFEPGTPQPQQFPQTDQADTFYPWIVFAGTALRAGELPLWDPYTFGGHPFFANGETNLLYPPRLILTRLLSPSWAQDLFLLLHVWASGLTMRLFLRRRGLGELAALLGATVWMFNSFTLGWLLLGHIAAITTLLPLALLGARATVERRSASAAAWTGAALGLMLLGSNILMTLVAWLAVGCYYGALLLGALVRGWRQNTSRARLRALAPLLVLPLATAFVGLGLGAVQLLPTLELAGQMARTSATYGRYVTSWRVPLATLGAILRPELPPTDRTLNNALWFVGWVPLLLAPFALTRRDGRGALVAAAALALYVLGTPLTWLGTALIPGLAYFRPLGRMLFVWALLWAIVAAIGADRFLCWLPERLSAARRWTPLFGALLVLGTAAPLIGYGRAINPPFQPRTAAALYPPTPLVERLLAAGPEARIAALRTVNGPEQWAPPMFQGSIPQSLGLRTAGGYESLLPARQADFWRIVKGEDPASVAANPVEDAVVLNFYPRRVRYDLLPQIGINLLAAVPDVTPAWLAANWPGLRVEPIYQGPDGWIYRLPDSRGVAYVSYRVGLVADERAALAATTGQTPESQADDLLAREDTSALPPLPAGNSCVGQGRAAQQIAAQTANTLTIDADSACAGLLVVNESWAPGWTATLDGHEVPILRTNYLARGVALPAGRHEVRFVYAPRSFTGGLILTFATSLTLLGLLVWRLAAPRSPRRRPRPTAAI